MQLGFVVGTAAAAVLNLADLLPSRWYFAVSALLGAGANAALAWAGDYPTALACRFVTGVCLAGVYPPAMKMAATWFRADRGLAIGVIVGSLTVGKAAPYLVRSVERERRPRPSSSPRRPVRCSRRSLVALGYRDGPFEFPRRPFSWRLVASVAAAPGDPARDRRLPGPHVGALRHVDLGARVPGRERRRAGPAAGGSDPGRRGLPARLRRDRRRRPRRGVGRMGGAAARATPASSRSPWRRAALCSLVVGLFYGREPLAARHRWCSLWGFFVVADSAQFSAMVTELSPPHAVGTALTLQTSLGFLLTMVTIQMIPALVEMVGWRLAFPVLALGPAAGIAAIRRLEVERAGAQP